MSSEVQNVEYPFMVKIETPTGQATVPIAFLTKQQVAQFLQTDFQKLTKEAGAKGTRVIIEQAVTADYDAVLREVTAHLRRAGLKTA